MRGLGRIRPGGPCWTVSSLFPSLGLGGLSMERAFIAIWATTAVLASTGLFIFPVARGALPWYAAVMLGAALLGTAVAAVWPARKPRPDPETGNAGEAAGRQQAPAGEAANGDGPATPSESAPASSSADGAEPPKDRGELSQGSSPRRGRQPGAVARGITLLACLSLAGGLALAAATETASEVWANSVTESALRQEQEQEVLVEYRSQAAQAAGDLLESIASLSRSAGVVSDAVASRITELSTAVKDITGSLKDVTGAVVDIASLFKKGGASGSDSSSSDVDISVENNVPPAKVTIVHPDTNDQDCHSPMTCCCNHETDW